MHRHSHLQQAIATTESTTYTSRSKQHAGLLLREYISLLGDGHISHPYKLEAQAELMDRYRGLVFCFTNLSIYRHHRDGTSLRLYDIQTLFRTYSNWVNFCDC